MLFRAGFLLLCMASLSTVAQAANAKLQVYYIPLEPLISRDGPKGPLMEVLFELGHRAKVKIEARYLPLLRIARTLDNGGQTASFPMLKSTIRNLYKKPVRLSVPIAFRISQTYVRPGKKPPLTLDGFKKLVLATSPSATLPEPLNQTSGLTVLETPSLATALKLLARGRVDALIHDRTLTNHAIRQNALQGIASDPAGLHFIQPAYIAFSSGVKAATVSKLNVAILSMVADGTLKKLLPGNFVDDYMAY